MATPYFNLGQIRSAVINDAKEASTTGLIAQVNRWINEGYERVAFRKKREWLDKQIVLQTVSCVNAVATVTNGSQTVTFESGTTFQFNPEVRELILWNQGFNEIYNVQSATSNVITLSNPYLGTSNTAANCVVAQKSFFLDSNIRHVWQAYHQWNWSPLKEIGPQVMRDIQEMNGPQTDYAIYSTIFGQSSTASDSSTAPNRRMLIYPYPDTAYTLYIDVNAYVTPLVNDTDAPIIPQQHRQILYFYAMYKLYSYHRNEPKAAEYMNNFNTMLAQIDGEGKPELDFPQIKVSYPRGVRRAFFPGFDTRYRELPD